ncbi:P-loop NTPase [Sediminispirochaeta bajacaliforniensis]|uniref:P-loop NTPase n=1 Tax=Sediminispirochaeta bajacaliforniensis TaxID=148 RepID=UPI000381E40C|nr:P-loop NTPase [Sediminispirochaeta bajacaliforniensis]
MRILPIASGKGGVGKSLVAANLSIALAQSGKKVVLADLDLGASNLHLILGVRAVKQGIGTFLTNAEIEFEEVILPTDYPNLRFIPGDAEIPGMANLKSSQKAKLIRKLRTIEADYIIIDLGAGTSYNTLDFFLSSSRGIIVTAPTLTATLNAYLFLKNSVFRLMNGAFRKSSPAGKYIENLQREGTPLQRVYIPRLLERIMEEDPESYKNFARSMANFHPMLVLNMLEDPEDGKKAARIRRSCKQYLDVDMEHLGVLYFDHLQEIALGSRIPIVAYKPQSVLSQGIYRIADKLIQKQDEGESPLDLMSLEESYQVAEMEAEIDFEAKVQDMENLLHSGALTRGDLIDTIRSQQYEISTLKKENQLLKSKLLKAAENGFQI